MNVLETRMLGICEFSPWVWWRFLDDVFLIWLHGEDRLKEFLEFIIGFHKTIKYTWDYSTNKVSYLVVSIYKERGGGGCDICTHVYSKPTDTHQYLDSKSCRPRHVKEAIPYGQALILRRICSSENIFDERVKELKGNLFKRGFKKDKISAQCEKAKAKDREALLVQNKVNKVNPDVVPLVLDFHPAFSEVRGIVEFLWPMLQASDDIKKIFKDK